VSPEGGPSRWDREDAEIHEERPEVYQEYFNTYGCRISKAGNFDRRVNELAMALARQRIEGKRLEERVRFLEERRGEPWQAKPGGLKGEPGP
jgi:hypothetical protein